ncbi:polymorphic toxin type 44 domain-containing protein [Paenibacillus chitinolyticus]|uniref:polymorphic toxin type 44 domain-containing protein n=1 Tax=Paenibacillus chitinolyticus TaxID=79263 RepID=UPI00386589B9
MFNRKKILSSLVALTLFGSLSSTAFASVIPITSEFSLKMRQNAAYMAYYALNDAQQNTWPIGTGKEFASKVPSGGPWDYKKVYKNADGYGFGGNWMRGEDLGNMHYGYVGRAAGFSNTLLSSAAGAYQIYSGTASIGWWNSYFDDPMDQEFINLGVNYWNNSNLPTQWPPSFSAQSSPNITDKNDPLFDLLTPQQKEEIEQKVATRSAQIKAEENQAKQEKENQAKQENIQ